jgi:hypothetical protein
MRRRLSTAGWLSALVALAALPATAALAAPFCLETQTVPPQCIYFDANDCRLEANHQRGACVVNPQEVGLVPNVGAYCIVTSGGASSCTYQDAGSCSREAVRQGGVCVAAPVAAAGPAPNPFQSRPGEAGQGTPTP